MAPEASKVFISYSSKDRIIASEIERRLEGLGVSVWIDKQIPTASRWEEEILKALDAASAILVIWTQNADDSEWVHKEIDHFLTRNHSNPLLEIITYRADTTELPEKLKPFQCNKNPSIAEYLRNWRAKPTSRIYSNLKSGHTFAEQETVKPAGEHLMRLPFCSSVHCTADLFAEPDWIVQIPVQPRLIAVLLATTRGADNPSDVELIRSVWKQKYPTHPFVLLRVAGPCRDGDYQMNDSAPNGEWMDVVETLYAGIQILIASDSGTLLFFTKTLNPLALLAGWRLDRYLHLELYHFKQGPPSAYHHVASSCELPRFP